jgi:hypothetical protein
MQTGKDRFPEERRSAFRHPYISRISFTTLGNSHAFPNDIEKSAEILDISNEGMKIKIAGHSLREGSMIKIRLPLSGLKATIPLLAEVMWGKHKIRNDYQAGLKFIVL